jgi:hypothetical protein
VLSKEVIQKIFDDSIQSACIRSVKQRIVLTDDEAARFANFTTDALRSSARNAERWLKRKRDEEADNEQRT